MARRVTRTTDTGVLGSLETDWEDFDEAIGDGLQNTGLAAQLMDSLTAPSEVSEKQAAAIRERQLEEFRAATMYRPASGDDQQGFER